MTVYFYLKITHKKLKPVFLWSIPWAAPKTHRAGSGSMCHPAHVTAANFSHNSRYKHWGSPMENAMIHYHQLPFCHPADPLKLCAGNTRGNALRQPSTPAFPSCPAGALHLQKWGKGVNKFPTFLKFSFQFDTYFNTLNLVGNFQHSSSFQTFINTSQLTTRSNPKDKEAERSLPVLSNRKFFHQKHQRCTDFSCPNLSSLWKPHIVKHSQCSAVKSCKVCCTRTTPASAFVLTTVKFICFLIPATSHQCSVFPCCFTALHNPRSNAQKLLFTHHSHYLRLLLFCQNTITFWITTEWLRLEGTMNKNTKSPQAICVYLNWFKIDVLHYYFILFTGRELQGLATN